MKIKAKFPIIKQASRKKIKRILKYGTIQCFFISMIFCLCAENLTAQQAKSYKAVTGVSKGKPFLYSPDPLVNMRWPSPRATDQLETYVLHPVSYNTSSRTSFDMKNFQMEHMITVNGPGDIRFDFGRVSAGWLEFDSDDLADSVSMSISEYNEPAIVNLGPSHSFKTAIPIKDGRTYRLVLNKQWYEGVRFGWLHIETHKRQWHIKNLRLVCQIKPTNYNGSFTCSDPELTRIWYTGAYTVKLNLLHDYFGAILMDRGDRQSWTGDAYPAQAASMVAFGNFDFVKKNLQNTAKLDNGIASYSLYWVLSLIDYVNYTGDTAFAQLYMANASKKLDLAFQQFGKNPQLAFYGWDERLGAGFENPENAESQNAYSMLSIRAWKEYSVLMGKIGNISQADKYLKYANEAISSIRKQGNWLQTFGLHAAADAINTGMTTTKEDSLFFSKNFTDRVNRLSYSPFNEWFIISAMANAQYFDEAISAVRDCWGGQLRYGGTTFFEDFRPQWNEILNKNDAPPNNQCGYTSLTHPWSAGVVKWLSEEILGIKPLTPGFKSFAIAPHLGKSLTYVRGSSPTPHGVITFSFDQRSGNARIAIPKGTIAKTIALPLGNSEPVYLKVNGIIKWQKGLASQGNISLVSNKNEHYLVLNDVKSGSYIYKIRCQEIIAQQPPDELPYNYKINSIIKDTTTSGNWKGTYGKQGFILFNFLKKGENVEQLPAYMDKVFLNKTADIHLESHSRPELLQDSIQSNGFGAIMTRDYNACEQTMTIDLATKDNDTHRVTLYFLDFNNLKRRSAIEIFDLKTLALIGPMIYVKHYEKGCYVSFNYNGPIRIRINQVRGINASVSGLFFDNSN